MKKFISLLAVLVVASSIPATAQMMGLPIASDARVPMEGSTSLLGGIVIGDDVTVYGGRITYGATENLAIFGDVGLVDPDDGDTGWSIQGGGLFSLPVDLPIEVAVRGTAAYTDLDQDRVDINLVTLNGGLLGSTDVEMVTIYGFLGLNYSRVEAEYRGHSDTDSETDVALGGGGILGLTDQISIYAELMHIDDLWVGLGGRLNF